MHLIIVLTNTPLKRIRSYLEAIEKFIKWATEINKYDIEYQPCPAIKAKSLANFLVETVRKEEQELLYLWTGWRIVKVVKWESF